MIYKKFIEYLDEKIDESGFEKVVNMFIGSVIAAFAVGNILDKTLPDKPSRKYLREIKALEQDNPPEQLEENKESKER